MPSQLTRDPFVVQKCVLLVLRPSIFLPEGRPILINTNRTLRTPRSPFPVQSGRTSWTSYCSNNSSPFLIDQSLVPYQQFKFKSLRHPIDHLSVFSLLVNANSKLQNIKNFANNSTLRSYITAIEATIDTIFHVPKEVHDLESRLAEPEPSHLSTRCEHSHQQSSMDLARQDSSSTENNHLSPNADPAEPDYDDEEEDDDEEDDDDEEEDDEPNTIHGLTFSEMETVIQRASDGRISARERADAAMQMLGMGGGEVSPFLCTFSSFLILSTRLRGQTFTAALSIDQLSL